MARAQVGGKLALIGSRPVDGAARKISGKFFERFGMVVGGDGSAGVVGASDDAQAPDGSRCRPPSSRFNGAAQYSID